MAGLGWLKQAINVGHHNPRAVFGGAALMFLMYLLPTAITMPMQLRAMHDPGAPDMTTYLLATALSMIAGFLLIPLIAGYLRLIDSSERGQPARARDIFAPYRQGEVLRLVGYGLAMLVVYLAVFAVIIAAAGTGIAHWYMQLLTAQASHQPPSAMALPDGFGIAIALFFVLGLWTMGVYAISLGQVALRGRSVLGAIGDGVVGSLKNLLPLLVFAISSVVAWIVVALVLLLVVGLAALLGKLAGMWLMFVVLVPLYIALVLVLFVVMFGVMYYLWRDVCGEDPAAGVAPAIAA